MATQARLMEGKGTMFDVNGQEGGKMETRGNRLLRPSGRTVIFILCVVGVALSMAFPYGLGLVVFSWVIALAGALTIVGFVCFRLLKDMLSGTATFGYAPTTSYMAGKKTRKRRKEESPEEEVKGRK